MVGGMKGGREGRKERKKEFDLEIKVIQNESLLCFKKL